LPKTRPKTERSSLKFTRKIPKIPKIPRSKIKKRPKFTKSIEKNPEKIEIKQEKVYKSRFFMDDSIFCRINESGLKGVNLEKVREEKYEEFRLKITRHIQAIKDSHVKPRFERFKEIGTIGNMFFPSNRLTKIQIFFIRNQFKKDYRHRDNPKIDQIISQLKFFQEFPQHLRGILLRNSTYHRYKEREMIFSQGDFGNKMYVIIRGSVNVLIRIKNFYGNFETLSVAVL